MKFRLFFVFLFLLTASLVFAGAGPYCQTVFDPPFVASEGTGYRHVGDPSGLKMDIINLTPGSPFHLITRHNQSGVVVLDMPLAADKNGEYHLIHDTTPIPEGYYRTGYYSIGIQTPDVFRSEE